MNPWCTNRGVSAFSGDSDHFAGNAPLRRGRVYQFWVNINYNSKTDNTIAHPPGSPLHYSWGLDARANIGWHTQAALILSYLIREVSVNRWGGGGGQLASLSEGKDAAIVGFTVGDRFSLSCGIKSHKFPTFPRRFLAFALNALVGRSVGKSLEPFLLGIESMFSGEPPNRGLRIHQNNWSRAPSELRVNVILGTT